MGSYIANILVWVIPSLVNCYTFFIPCLTLIVLIIVVVKFTQFTVNMLT